MGKKELSIIMILLGSLFLSVEILLIAWIASKIDSSIVQVAMSFPAIISWLIPITWIIAGIIFAVKLKGRNI